MFIRVTVMYPRFHSLWKILLNVFEMSKSNPWTSKPSSNYSCISYVINKHWLTQELCCLKLDLFGEIRLLSIRQGCI